MFVTVRAPPRPLDYEPDEAEFVIAVDTDAEWQEKVAIRAGDSFELPNAVRGDGTLKASLIVDSTPIDFEFSGAQDSDLLEIELVRVDFAEAKLTHPPRLQPCRARCYDGKVGQPCVDCVRNGRTVRICC